MNMTNSEPIEPAPPDTLDEEEGFQGSDYGGSDYGESLASSGFTSLASRVMKHSHEGGRRYQSFLQGIYPLPNDETEQFREEMKHQLIKRLLDENDYLSPIGSNPQKIMDVGTGTGLWAVDIADKFPSAHVIGVDISPIQNCYAPQNVDWRIDDIEETWSPLYANLDFIHMRSVCVTLRQPVKVIHSAYQNLRPGGWIEFQDAGVRIGCDDNTLPKDYAPAKFMDRFISTFKTHYGWDLEFPDILPDILREAGFVNIHYRFFKLPIGPWAKDRQQREIGLFLSKDVLWQLVRAVLVKWSQLGLTKQEADTMEQDIRKAFHDTRIHGYLPWISVWAQKPPA
ncbi:methyltransferase domain-containing protein [Colletotrichum orchidophilum]|uniref:Methyltransferase domain-containing protein n=1 Tax=Colletotrichum orchidophilum TaxID=1209926 RepID=A0A1G4BJH0_9PEZI|nr:methyltransferase domain-containing protein [Colletotrichum orchidophilum]OHF01443.1 methyltransferase domain-containing protein [Colletotrichum orchidophilum]